MSTRVRVPDAGVGQCFHQGLVGVGRVEILADDGDARGLCRIVQRLDDALPFAEIGIGAVELQFLGDDIVQVFRMQLEGSLVDGVEVLEGDHRPLLDVCEQRDLAPRGLRDRLFGAAHQDVRLQSDGSHLLDRVLRRLCLGLAGRAQVGHQRQVNEKGARCADLEPQLPHRLEEGQRLDVAHGAADLHQHDIDVITDGEDAALDLVGYVGDDLHRAPEVVAAALVPDDLGIHAAGREVVVLRHAPADEPLVVPEVEIRLCAVRGDIDFAVLERAHGAGIHVDVGIHLEDVDLEIAGFEDRRQGGGEDTLPQRRSDATGNENVVRQRATRCPSCHPQTVGTLPIWRAARWADTIAKSGFRLNDPHPRTPGTGAR